MNNHAKDPIVHTKLQSSITPRKKRNSKKSFYFWILRWTSFLMIPLTFLYDEYIDRPKFTEQKKKPIWVYSSFPHKWGRNKNLCPYDPLASRKREYEKKSCLLFTTFSNFCGQKLHFSINYSKKRIDIVTLKTFCSDNRYLPNAKGFNKMKQILDSLS